MEPRMWDVFIYGSGGSFRIIHILLCDMYASLSVIESTSDSKYFLVSLSISILGEVFG